jgi:hypothetical protein
MLVGSWQRVVGSWQLAVGRKKLEIGIHSQILPFTANCKLHTADF